MKRAAKNIGIGNWRQVRPKSLRVAFESALRNANLDPKDQEYLMGHILPGSQDYYYDRFKVEELREKYSEVRFFPGTDIGEVREDFEVKIRAKDAEIADLREILEGERLKWEKLEIALDKIEDERKKKCTDV